MFIRESNWAILDTLTLISGVTFQGVTMPILHLEMHPGRTSEQKRAFVREVTRVAVETLTCPPESVDVVICEVSRENWAKAGKLIADK
jgi:4-oxalocrotonate tautomerase